LLVLQGEINNRLSFQSQWRFYKFSYKAWKEATTTDPQPMEALIPSNYFFGDAVKAALHWRLYYLSHGDYKKFSIASKTHQRIIAWSQALVRC